MPRGGRRWPSDPEPTPEPAGPVWAWDADAWPTWEHFGWRENALLTAAPDGAPALRVQHQGSPDQTARTGIDLRVALPAADEYVLAYRVYFPLSFDWVEGGKLPGLSGRAYGVTAGGTSAGGALDPRSWSGRLYWKPGGGLVSYLYVPYAAGRSFPGYGISPRWMNDTAYARLIPGRWNDLKIRYRMNTPGVRNGIHQGWLNGTLCIDLNDVVYRDAAHPDLRINQLFAACFYGGPKGPIQPQANWLDSFVVT